MYNTLTIKRREAEEEERFEDAEALAEIYQQLKRDVGTAKDADILADFEEDKRMLEAYCTADEAQLTKYWEDDAKAKEEAFEESRRVMLVRHQEEAEELQANLEDACNERHFKISAPLMELDEKVKKLARIQQYDLARQTRESYEQKLQEDFGLWQEKVGVAWAAKCSRMEIRQKEELEELEKGIVLAWEAWHKAKQAATEQFKLKSDSQMKKLHERLHVRRMRLRQECDSPSGARLSARGGAGGLNSGRSTPVSTSGRSTPVQLHISHLMQLNARNLKNSPTRNGGATGGGISKSGAPLPYRSLIVGRPHKKNISGDKKRVQREGGEAATASPSGSGKVPGLQLGSAQLGRDRQSPTTITSARSSKTTTPRQKGVSSAVQTPRSATDNETQTPRSVQIQHPLGLTTEEADVENYVNDLIAQARDEVRQRKNSNGPSQNDTSEEAPTLAAYEVV